MPNINKIDKSFRVIQKIMREARGTFLLTYLRKSLALKTLVSAAD